VLSVCTFISLNQANRLRYGVLRRYLMSGGEREAYQRALQSLVGRVGPPVASEGVVCSNSLDE